jgi:glycosyltransferase involved in cell wall biosynthesis
MKIGMLVDTYLPILGGAEVHVLELSRALHELGYEIAVCTAVPDAPTPHPFPNSGGGENILGGEVDNFPVLRLPGLMGGSWRALLGVPAALPRLIPFIRDVDFVHCHYSFLMAASGTLLARLLGKPSAVTLHGLGTLDSSVGRSSLYRLYRYISLKLGGTIIATSQEMRDVALRFAAAKKIVTIPNGVNSRAFSPALSEDQAATQQGELVILTMRRLAPKNGVQYLVEAAPEVVAALPNARFWVAGEGKLEGHIRQRVAELGVEPYFRFLGIVPHEKTPDYYRKADIAVFPSSAESTSLACLEAMSTERAIIASRLAAYLDMLGRAGERGILVPLFDREASDYNAPLTLPPERIRALAQAIITLGCDPQRRRQLGREARRFAVEHYDWSTIAAQTVRVYHGEVE